MSRRPATRANGTHLCISGLKIGAVAIALVLSALLTTISLATPKLCLLAWVSLVPLLAAIRAFLPMKATLCGVFWGSCLYVSATTAEVISPTTGLLILLITIPGGYALFGSVLTRKIGFNPLMLALGWIVVEIALKPLGLNQGLLGASDGGAGVAHWIGRLLGYVFVAAMVVLVNASLLAVLSHARVAMPCPATAIERAASPTIRMSSQLLCPHQLFALLQGHPRAPPFFR